MIGKHLKRIRKMKDLSIREVAKKTGGHHGHISMIENGRMEPTDEVSLNILVKAFDYTYSEAKDMLAEWHALEAIQKAANPNKVLGNIKMGKKSNLIIADDLKMGDINN